MLNCATSLWSADLANLAVEIKRVEAFSERFHLDVADGHYADTMLFFPDLVAALRPYTKLPLEVHLITLNPLKWIKPFVESGADTIIFYPDTTPDPAALIATIKAAGKQAGVSLRLEDPLDIIEAYWQDLDILTLMATAHGIKGAEMDESIPDKIRQARQTMATRNLSTEIEIDGGIRRWSVPLIHSAGADTIVPGSLIFKEDPPAMRDWLASLS
jgi:ribulose-phosphate 3-epimerase